MTEDLFDPTTWVRELLGRQSKRDKQVRVGASNLSNPCSRCLAFDLYGYTQPVVQGRRSKYWLGARIGTAIHESLEAHNTDPDFESEVRVELGAIPGYGTVKSTTDLYHPASGTVVDYKTTTREKLEWIKRAVREEPNEYEVSAVAEARTKVVQYQTQTFLYGMGLIRSGRQVNRCALVFVCRDGKTDEDVWGFDYPYRPEQAQAAWDRGVLIWQWLELGGDPDELVPHPHCFRCTIAPPADVEPIDL